MCYRSILFKASTMLAGILPADLLAIARAMMVTRLEAVDNDPISATTISKKKREVTINKCQRHKLHQQKESGQGSCCQTSRDDAEG